MNGDIISCLNPYCNMEFKDTTKLKMQDSRSGRFINRCPYCHGVNTINTNENAVKRTKFIYIGSSISREEGSHNKSNGVIKKPDLGNYPIAKEVLGHRQRTDIHKVSIPPGRTRPGNEPLKNDDWYTLRRIITKGIVPTKSYTPQELMQQKINSRLEEMKSAPDNYRKYNHWWRQKHADK